MPTSNGRPPQNRGLTAIAGAMSLITVLLIVQIWLLSAATPRAGWNVCPNWPVISFGKKLR